jgi:N-methylhydantoinase A
VFVPPHAGVLSALGLALAPERREALASVLARCDTLDAAAVRGVLDRLSEATAATVASGAPAMRRDWWWRVRFAGQGHELEVPVTPGDDGAAIADRFAALHRARFGFALDAPVDVVSARATATGAARPVAFARRGTGAWDPGDPRDTGGVLDVTVSGPASVALPDATLRVAPGWTARPLPIGGWMVEAP